MSPTFRSQIETAAARFAKSVIQAVRGASLADILAETEGAPENRGPGRPRKIEPSAAPTAVPPVVKRGRGRPNTILLGNVSAAVVFVKSNPGASGGVIRRVLGIHRESLKRTMNRAVETGLLRREGEKRKSTYWPV